MESHVAALLSGFDGSHDIHHIKRVVANASKLSLQEGITDSHSLSLISAAAWLHDTDDAKYGGHGGGDLPNARRVLAEVGGFTPEDIARICAIIEGVSFTGEKKAKAAAAAAGSTTTPSSPIPLDPLTAIVQDADRLDAIGAHGIARCFTFGGARNRALGNSVEHFHDKLLHLKGLMKTQAGRREASQRHDFMVEFLAQMDREARGGGEDTTTLTTTTTPSAADITSKDNQSSTDLTSPPSVVALGLRVFDVPILPATAENLVGYGHPITDFASAPLSITPWPVSGWRPLCPGTGDEGGFVEDVFVSVRKGGVQFSENVGLGRKYVIGWYGEDPAAAAAAAAAAAGGAAVDPPPHHLTSILTHEANYHPDGGQIFATRLGGPAFVLLLAKPGDDITPASFTAFYVDPAAPGGVIGVHADAGVWHQPAFPANGAAGPIVLQNRQGKVHGCVACDFVKEFGGYLRVPLTLT